MDCKFISCILLFLCQIWMTSAYWWLLGIEPEISEVPSSNAPLIAACDTLNRSLATDHQKEYCQSHQRTVPFIALGIRRSILQCQEQFDNSRWNCTTFHGDNLFGKFINDGTRETGFVNAMLAAGAALEIASACRDEKIEDCTCQVSGINQPINGSFYTFRCDYNVDAAKTAINNLLNDNNVEENATVLRRSEVHNHNVGLEVVRNVSLYCRCNGLSGTCSVQVCYYKAPDYEVMAATLKSKYDASVEVEVDQMSKKLVPVLNQVIDVTDLTITHAVTSPSFCITDTTRGIIGTEHRQCDDDPTSIRSCAILCCDRGHYTVNTVTENKNCVFHYCCYFQCTTTNVTTPTHFCNP